MVGFEKPILHGLCSYGIACRAVLKHYCNNDVKLFKSMKTRFTNPIIPGSTLEIKLWKEGNRVYFVTQTEGAKRPALSSSYVDLHGTSTDSSIPRNVPVSNAPVDEVEAIF